MLHIDLSLYICLFLLTAAHYAHTEGLVVRGDALLLAEGLRRHGEDHGRRAAREAQPQRRLVRHEVEPEDALLHRRQALLTRALGEGE